MATFYAVELNKNNKYNNNESTIIKRCKNNDRKCNYINIIYSTVLATSFLYFFTISFSQ